MTRTSPDDAMALMRAADPVSVAELRATIDKSHLARAMRRAIAAGESPERPIPVGDRAAIDRGAGGGAAIGRGGILRRHRVASVGFGLVCAAVIALLVVIGGGSVDSVKDGGRPTYAAAAVKVAEANPRLLITAPGWSIVHADAFATESGGLTYKKAGHPVLGPNAVSAGMNWEPASYYRDAVRGYRRDGTAMKVTVAGRQGSAFLINGGAAYLVVLPPQGSVFVTLSLPAAEHEAMLRSVRAVGVDRWLAAMPPEVVQPTDESTVIASMLRGVPLPPGFEVSSLESERVLINRYELGQAVAGAVACGWMESWAAAKRSGDPVTAEAAVAGMSGARHWAVLLQMVHEKGFEGDGLPAHGVGWPSYIVEASRELAAGHLRRRPAVRTTRDAQGNVVGMGYSKDTAPASFLGCHLGG
jgi:hypothetical protein